MQLSCSTLGYPYVALCSAGVVKVLKYGMVVLQVTQEVAALSAVATMDELLEASELIDDKLRPAVHSPAAADLRIQTLEDSYVVPRSSKGFR